MFAGGQEYLSLSGEEVVVEEDSAERSQETLEEECRGEAVREVAVSLGEQKDGDGEESPHQGPDGGVIVQAPDGGEELIILAADREDGQYLG